MATGASKDSLEAFNDSASVENLSSLRRPHNIIRSQLSTAEERENRITQLSRTKTQLQRVHEDALSVRSLDRHSESIDLDRAMQLAMDQRSHSRFLPLTNSTKVNVSELQ